MFLRVLILLLLWSYSESSTEWNYDDASNYGPSHWAASYPICGRRKQSPININTSALQEGTIDQLHKLDNFIFVNYDKKPATLTMVNNGRTVQVNLPSGDSIKIAGAGLGATFTLTQLHFHWGPDNTLGSEHLIDSKAAPLEIHMVHWNSDKYKSYTEASTRPEGIAVLSILVKIASDSDSKLNKDLGELTESIDQVLRYNTNTSVDPFPMQSLIPANSLYFRYFGSFTTPSCDEVVTWTVFKGNIFITNAQMAKFRTIYQDKDTLLLKRNYRPVQPMKGRVVYLGRMAGAQASLNGSPSRVLDLPRTPSVFLVLWATIHLC